MPSPRLIALAGLLVASLVAPTVSFADTPVKRPLAHSDFDSWRAITSPTVARDGSWLAYAYMPQEGDGDLLLRQLATDREIRVPIGALPPAPTGPSEENPERAAPRREPTIMFTSDARFAIATLFPNLADTRAAKRAKKKADELPPEGLIITTLATGDTTRITGVKNFQVPAKSGHWLAYLKTAPAEKDKAAEKPAPKKKEQKLGTELVLRDLATGAERSFPDVLEYSLTRDGRTLVFTVSSSNDSTNGVFVLTSGSSDAPLALATGPGRYQKLTWDRAQTQLAFTTDRANPDAKPAAFAVYHWRRDAGSTATEIINRSTTGLRASWAVTADSPLSFSFDGTTLTVGTAVLPPAPDERIENQLDDEKVTADLWRWNDDYIQPLQQIRATREKSRTYLAAFHLADQRFTQLADATLETVTLSDDGSRAIGYDNRAYRRRVDYDGDYQDAYLVNTRTGDRQLVARELGERAGLRWSPNSRWLAYFSAQHWFAIDARDGRIIPLTQNLGVALHDEQDDLPQDAPAYGFGGWTSDGESLLVYDRFDVWQLFPNGRAPRNLTAGFGRGERIALRVQVIEPNDPEDDTRGLDQTEPLYVRGESEVTRATGFFRTTFDATAAPARLLWADKNFRYASRAHDADTLVLTASRFDEFPDLHVTNAAFAAPKKISDGSTQLAPFLWGSAELMSFRNTDGVPLTAALYKPANFDPQKKYPVIVYLYERLSQIVHTFTPPAPGQNINPSVYTSNGYLVLMPDVVYDIGQPGKSALKCILPAVDALVARGCVDENAIGIQGHSWGGYQIAYLITQTSRFRAAEAGAIVSNMTSAYSGIRWGSGRARQFQYEKTQSRIGRPLHEAPHLYIENSPLFAVENVTTPLLLLHNDRDDAVPWQQGIEFFLALRRLNKEAYLFNYNGARHGLRRRADLEDYTVRLRQFFDHFLKGAPAPAWMTDGIPYLDRDAEKLRFRDQN